VYEAANALAQVTAPIDYQDFVVGKGEESRTVRTSTEQIKRISEQSNSKMISASAPRCNDVN
jgi:hypothetical protein